MAWVAFGFGCMVGASIGVFALAMVQMAARGDAMRERFADNLRKNG